EGDCKIINAKTVHLVKRHVVPEACWLDHQLLERNPSFQERNADGHFDDRWQLSESHYSHRRILRFKTRYMARALRRTALAFRGARPLLEFACVECTS